MAGKTTVITAASSKQVRFCVDGMKFHADVEKSSAQRCERTRTMHASDGLPAIRFDKNPNLFRLKEIGCRSHYAAVLREVIHASRQSREKTCYPWQLRGQRQSQYGPGRLSGHIRAAQHRHGHLGLLWPGRAGGSQEGSYQEEQGSPVSATAGRPLCLRCPRVAPGHWTES